MGQVIVQCRLAMNQVFLVPANARTTLPHYRWDVNQNKVMDTFPQGNSLKTDRSIGTWTVINHHLAFIPFADSYPMPSGAFFSTAVVTIQLQQKATFYIWNTVGVIAPLPLLAVGATLQGIGDVADRMSIILALLLTMATYMVSINAWIPQKEYLTWTDKYILSGFFLILFFGTVNGIVCTIAKYINPERFYPSWENTMWYEKEDVRLVAQKVTAEYEWVQKANKVLTEDFEEKVEWAPKEASANKFVHKTLTPKPVISPEEQEINEREEQWPAAGTPQFRARA